MGRARPARPRRRRRPRRGTSPRLLRPETSSGAPSRGPRPLRGEALQEEAQRARLTQLTKLQGSISSITPPTPYPLPPSPFPPPDPVSHLRNYVTTITTLANMFPLSLDSVPSICQILRSLYMSLVHTCLRLPLRYLRFHFILDS